MCGIHSQICAALSEHDCRARGNRSRLQLRLVEFFECVFHLLGLELRALFALELARVSEALSSPVLSSLCGSPTTVKPPDCTTGSSRPPLTEISGELRCYLGQRQVYADVFAALCTAAP